MSDQKPWLGSRLFGMCMVNREGGMATVGTTLTITDFSNLDDGRIFVVTKGESAPYIASSRCLCWTAEPVTLCRRLGEVSGAEDY